MVASRSRTPVAYRARCRARYRPRVDTGIIGSIPGRFGEQQRDGAMWYAPQREHEPVSRRCTRRCARRGPASSRRDRRHAPDPAQRSVIDLVTEMDQRSEAFIVGAPARGVSGPRRPRRGERRDRRPIRLSLGDRSPRRHHELRPRRADLRGLGRARTRRGRRAGRRLRPEPDECFVAERGRGATMNGEPIRVSRADTLDQALLVTGFPYDIRTTAATNLPEYASSRSERRRSAGSARRCSTCAGWRAAGSRATGSSRSARGTWRRGASSSPRLGPRHEREGGPWRVGGAGHPRRRTAACTTDPGRARDARVTRR